MLARGPLVSDVLGIPKATPGIRCRQVPRGRPHRAPPAPEPGVPRGTLAAGPCSAHTTERGRGLTSPPSAKRASPLGRRWDAPQGYSSGVSPARRPRPSPEDGCSRTRPRPGSTWKTGSRPECPLRRRPQGARLRPPAASRGACTERSSDVQCRGSRSPAAARGLARGSIGPSTAGAMRRSVPRGTSPFKGGGGVAEGASASDPFGRPNHPELIGRPMLWSPLLPI